MDITTLFAAQSVMLFGYTIVLVLVARSQPEQEGTRWFAWACATLMAGTMFGAWVGGPFDAWAVTGGGNGHAALQGTTLGALLILLDDTLMLVPMVLVRNGLAAFTGRAARRRAVDGPILAVAVCALIWFTLGDPGPLGRGCVLSLVVGIEGGLCCLLLGRHRPEGVKDAAHAMIAILALVTLQSWVRVLSVVLLHAPLLKFLPVMSPGISILFRMFGSFSVFACFLWMVTEQLRSSLEQMAHTDYLTGTLNRRSLRICAEREIAASQRTGTRLSVLVVDVDHFKLVNDIHGHSMGDESLRRIASELREMLRHTDLLARYGGEEFVIVLSETDGESALLLAERLRARIEALALTSERGPLRLTASFGVAQYRHNSESWDTLLARADLALYQAKQTGRNRAVLAASA